MISCLVLTVMECGTIIYQSNIWLEIVLSVIYTLFTVNNLSLSLKLIHQCDIKHTITTLKNSIASVLKGLTYIDTSITIGLALLNSDNVCLNLHK